MQRIDVAERRARIGARHCLAPGHQASDVVGAARSLVCLHGTDPGSVYLSAQARVGGMTTAQMDQALYDDRSLVKHLAMRRTLFVFPREVLPAAQAGASERVAARERRRLVQDVEGAGLHRDGSRWLDRASVAVLEVLADGRDATSSELRDEVPLLEGSITFGEGKAWGGKAAIGPRVLTVLSAAGHIVRATNEGPWTSSRPRWASMQRWLGAPLATMPEAAGVSSLVEQWLRVFGPGTEVDIKWWLGSTLTSVRRALADLDAVEVDLDGRVGYLLPDDLDASVALEPWAALLPPLDPTTMGWFERDWYLGDHKADLFDATGNGGSTIWWDGRIVGGWRQGAAADVELQLLEDVGRDGRRAIEAKAAALSAWLDGVRVVPRFPAPLSKRVAGSTP